MSSSLTLREGTYYELICRLCEPGVETPLGLKLEGGRARFRVYSRKLRASMRETERLVCLAPVDPLVFYESVVEGKSVVSCSELDSSRGHWLVCKPELVEEREDYDVYACTRLEVVRGASSPYARAYGCLVELLVLLTKARAGVLGAGALEYARWLSWCIERSSSVESYVRAARNILELLERALRES
ncbi:MAG: DUF447 family protein [Acidilobaceae archaeon]